MSLATRCTSCGTIFRVVQDQLKLSEGWVRCGRCQEVFSALEGLFDLEREAPPLRAEPKPGATEPASEVAAEFVASPSGEPTDFDPFADVGPGAPAVRDPHPHALPSTDEADAIESRFLPQPRAGDRMPGSMLLNSDSPDDEFLAARFAADAADEAPSADPTDDGVARAPARASFLQRWRERREGRQAALASSMLEPALESSSAHAQSIAPDVGANASSYLGSDAAPGARPLGSPIDRSSGLLAAVAVLLVAGLLGQVAYQFRDVFATQWPQSRGALLALCEWTGCQVGPLRRLAAVTVEDSGLTQVQGAEAYRLSVTLHNRSAFEVALPSIDLSLTDGSGALVARRALAPRDFSGAPGAAAESAITLAPGSEAHLQALLAAQGARISGYTVELFYP